MVVCEEVPKISNCLAIFPLQSILQSFLFSSSLVFSPTKTKAGADDGSIIPLFRTQRLEHTCGLFPQSKPAI
ncbi:hypothetical protein PGT21_033370 [Puccinia graminis f. sp. tritici]|uniref:Uncharacterized protein n=1 Tax=Puccinia graminis f. sp. tritici TaxID=56615 RepID=A0A5B0QK94_PUCGR|nr:hypothetical protein PGT21_033278 [Puccinia graminis f. sp. tritici]KAA1113547.1 hypothetical protein PGT21_033370 [Puccinia graminis f. sp. tritici]